MHPDLFSIPIGDDPFVVGSYGFMVGLGLVVGWIWALRFAVADRLPADKLGTAYVLSAGVGVFGARALWIAQHGGDAAEFGGWLALRSGEFATGAGIFLAIGVSLALCARYGAPFFAWADAAAPAALGALAFERIGAFLAGTNFGVYVDPTHPLGVRFPADSPVYAYQRATMTGMHFDPEHSLPVHPVQLYGLVALLVGLGVVSWLRHNRRFSGQVAIAALIVFVAVRMIVEDPFRVDHSPEVWGPLRLGLLSALAMCAAAGALLYVRGRQAEADDGGLREWEGGAWSRGADAGEGKRKGEAKGKDRGKGRGKGKSKGHGKDRGR